MSEVALISARKSRLSTAAKKRQPQRSHSIEAVRGTRPLPIHSPNRHYPHRHPDRSFLRGRSIKRICRLACFRRTLGSNSPCGSADGHSHHSDIPIHRGRRTVSQTYRPKRIRPRSHGRRPPHAFPVGADTACRLVAVTLHIGTRQPFRT